MITKTMKRHRFAIAVFMACIIFAGAVAQASAVTAGCKAGECCCGKGSHLQDKLNDQHFAGSDCQASSQLPQTCCHLKNQPVSGLDMATGQQHLNTGSPAAVSRHVAENIPSNSPNGRQHSLHALLTGEKGNRLFLQTLSIRC